MAGWIWILIVIVIAAVIAVAVTARQRRTALLRRRFGPEYDRMVGASEDRRAAEAELRERERQRAQLTITPLAEPHRLAFLSEWRDVQELFVDEPAQAVDAAHVLVGRVMAARGYPGTVESQADLLSVDYPDAVHGYRAAREVQELSGTRPASTEELREALLRFRSLSDRLLQTEDAAGAGGEGEAAPAAVPGTAGQGTDRDVR